MQITMKNRESISSVTTYYTPPVDVSGMSMLLLALIVHQATGTSPNIAITLQTSANLEDWTNMTAAASLGATGYTQDTALASTDQYGRYVRASIVITGTAPYFNFSLFLNTFPSS